MLSKNDICEQMYKKNRLSLIGHLPVRGDKGVINSLGQIKRCFI